MVPAPTAAPTDTARRDPAEKLVPEGTRAGALRRRLNSCWRNIRRLRSSLGYNGARTIRELP
jgi:hypothetical protein